MKAIRRLVLALIISVILLAVTRTPRSYSNAFLTAHATNQLDEVYSLYLPFVVRPDFSDSIGIEWEGGGKINPPGCEDDCGAYWIIPNAIYKTSVRWYEIETTPGLYNWNGGNGVFANNIAYFQSIGAELVLTVKTCPLCQQA